MAVELTKLLRKLDAVQLRHHVSHHYEVRFIPLAPFQSRRRLRKTMHNTILQLFDELLERSQTDRLIIYDHDLHAIALSSPAPLMSCTRLTLLS
jgi:hypothetical protein